MMVRLPQSLVRFYKKAFSPALLSTCRYTPTCSDYALEAIERNGVIWGGALALWRIARCHPFAKGGLDTVPVSLKSHAHGIHTCEIGKNSGERGVSAGLREQSARAESLATEPWI